MIRIRARRPHAGLVRGLMSTLLLLAAPPLAHAAWDAKPDPPAEPVKLAARPGQSVPLPNPSGMAPVFPTTPSPFVAVGQNDTEEAVREVWDLRTFERAGTLKGKFAPTSYSPSRLSPDGKYLAILAHDDAADRAVEVYAFATGEKVLRATAEPPPKKVLAFDLAAGGRLVIALELDKAKAKALQTYDLATGAKLGELPLSAGFQDGSLAVSPGGRQVAFIAEKDLVIVDPASGKTLGKVPHGSFSCAGMAFSPDGSELAAVFLQDPGSRLICWEVANGEVVADYPFPSGPTFPTPGWSDGGRTVDWLPDGSAWLLEGHALVNRKDGQWVWNLFAPPSKGPDGNFLPDGFIYYQGAKLLDDDHAIAGARARGATPRLEVVTIPWPKIDASLKAAEEKAPALLGPGGSISLKIDVGAVRFSTPQEVKDQLAAAIGEGLSAAGITVADGQPVVLHVRHAEESGPGYRIMGPRLPNGANMVTSTRFITELSLTVPNTKAPVWISQKVETGLGHFATDRQTGGRIDEAGMRQGGFRGVQASLKSLGLPYFIPNPKDKHLALLPGTTLVTPSPASARRGTSKARASKPTLRGKAGSP